jgi:hypothetical protein
VSAQEKQIAAIRRHGCCAKATHRQAGNPAADENCAPG